MILKGILGSPSRVMFEATALGRGLASQWPDYCRSCRSQRQSMAEEGINGCATLGGVVADTPQERSALLWPQELRMKS